MINKDDAILKWISQCADLEKALNFGVSTDERGRFSLIPLGGGERLSFIDGTKVKFYDCALQVALIYSMDSDNTNTDNMYSLRRWADWLEKSEKEGNFPDFGEKCNNYRFENLDNEPKMAIVYENGTAKYTYSLRLVYEEKL